MDPISIVVKSIQLGMPKGLENITVDDVPKRIDDISNALLGLLYYCFFGFVFLATLCVFGQALLTFSPDPQIRDVSCTWEL